MTDPVDVVTPEVGEGESGIVEKANEHTPEPKAPPVVEKLPDPPRGDVEGMKELSELVHGLATTVENLTGLVMAKNPDESVGSVPWTARGGSGKKSWDED